jgi:hypothetical protein
MTKEQKKEYDKQRYQLKKKEINERNKKYYENYFKENKEKLRSKSKENYYNNIEYELERSRNYRNKNKERIKEKYNINKEKYNKIRNEKRKELMKTNSLYKLKHNVRTLISHSILRKKFRKNSKTANILGCSFEEFKLHLESKFESWMSWDNYGNPKDNIYEQCKTWDIDHIIPIDSAETIEDVIRLCHYTNLQPLCSYHNRWVKSNNLF